jgi:uroporphyrinogen-III synthase
VRVAVQLHGDPMTDFLDTLRAAGADVVTVTVYRWEPPLDPGAADELIDAIVARRVDTVTFTSAPAVEGLLHRAEVRGLRVEVVGALASHEVLACCVGPVTAAPLERLGVVGIAPERFRLAAMVKRLEEHATTVPVRP